MIRPSCPALVVHDDDAFRKSLIATLDQHHFTVTFTTDGDGAIELLAQRKFLVVIVALNLQTGKGARTLEHLREQNGRDFAVILLGDPDPRLRTYAPWANETLLKPVDPAYVAKRARAYCSV
ncbi:MAG TPA: response regulator [Thermoanaerobaculia bacterium]|nr:response regulator [Thermoanaerobaculia bacterium]